MPDEKAKTGKADDIRVNMNESYEVQFWWERLGVSPQALRNAVATVGPMVSDLRREFGK